MLETSARLLRLLSLLQARRDWTGTELAARLGVTTRTVRNDIDRLRDLGYPVEARPGVAGGYRLGAGATLPPAPRRRRRSRGRHRPARRLLRRPHRRRRNVPACPHQTPADPPVTPPPPRRRLPLPRPADPRPRPRTDPDTLTTLASACRDHERLRFDYQAHSGTPSRRTVEPYRLAHHRQRWYLLAWDLDRSDWRTFRADRIQPRTPAGPRFTPRPLPPDDDIADRIARQVGQATWHYRARIIVHKPAAHVRERLPISVEIEELDDDRCAFEPGADDPRMLVLYLGLLDADFEVVDSPELVEALRAIAERYRRAVELRDR